MASEPMSDARIVEITQAFADIPQGSKPIVIYDTDAFRALLAEVERLRAREAALLAEREQAMAVVRETAAMIEIEPGVLMTDDDRLPYCPVCNHNDFDAKTPGDFRHSANCTVAKARALLASASEAEWRITPSTAPEVVMKPTDATTASCEFCGSNDAVKAHDMGGDRIMRLCRGCRQLIADGGVVE